MYDELVKRLRDAAKMSEALAVLLPHSEGNATVKLYNEAADAIEEMSKRVDESIPKDDAEIIIAEVAKPRWIPVTERLPREMETVIVTDGKNVGYSFCVNDYGTLDFYSPWNITHWMPLPEPPKEET